MFLDKTFEECTYSKQECSSAVRNRLICLHIPCVPQAIFPHTHTETWYSFTQM